MLAFSYVTPNPEQITGISSYADSLVAAVASKCAGEPVLLFTNANARLLARATDCSNVQLMQVANASWCPYKIYALVAHAYISCRAWMKGCRAQVSTTPVASVLPINNQYFTLLDLYDIDPHFRARRTVAYARVMWPYFARVATGIICISEATRCEAAHFLPHAASKMRAIKLASKFCDNASVGAATSGGWPTFAFVATAQPTKNVECLLSALSLAQIAGHTVQVDWIGWDPQGIVGEWVRKNGSLSNFKARGAVSDEVLRGIYRNAAALIVPSFKEGFCLPVLEAQHFGTPIIASDIPTLREVVGDGGLFFDPTQPEELLKRMLALADNDLRRDLSAKALRNVKKYSWTKAAAELVTFVDEPRNSVSTRRGWSGLSRAVKRLGWQ